MPLVQAAPNRREWLKTIAVMGLCIVLVTIVFGAILGAPASLLAGTVGSRRTSSQIVQAALIATGILMMVVALGELALIRRFLPGPSSASTSAEGTPETPARGVYRQAAVLGLSMAATFGIMCPKPLYLALLVYVALVGNILYGALALGAYGLGLVAALALTGLILVPAGRAARLSGWLTAHQERFHFIQGFAFAFLGAMSVAFWVRYTLPPA